MCDSIVLVVVVVVLLVSVVVLSLLLAPHLFFEGEKLVWFSAEPITLRATRGAEDYQHNLS